MNRMIEIFTIKELSYFEYFFNVKEDNATKVETVAAKLSVQKVGDRRESIGYVMNENEKGQNLIVLLENNERIVFEIAPRFVEGIWDYGHLGEGIDPINDEIKYEIIAFHPIRMKLFFSGWFHISYNHLTLRFDQPKVTIEAI